MEKYLPLLESSPLFAGYSRSELFTFLKDAAGAVRTYGAGSLLLSAGDSAQYFGLLLKGRARIIREDFYGRTEIISEVSPGKTFGEVFACAGLSSVPVSVIAVDECDILWINYSRALGASCKGQFVQNLLRVTAEKNLILNRKLELLSRRSLREKLLYYLSSQAKEAGSAEFDIPLDRQGLADFLAADRSAVSSLLSRLQKEGILEFHKNHFQLKKNGRHF